MDVKEYYTFFISIFFGLKYIIQIQGDSSFTDSSYTVKGFSASLQCTVTPLSSPVEFRKSSIYQGQCAVPGIPASCTTSVSQSGDTTYFNITSLNYTQHDGEWSCINSVANRYLNLTVYSPYGDTSISVTSQGDTALATCQMKCQYPINDDFTSVEIWKSDGKVKSITSYTASDPSANDGCEAHEKNLVATFNLSSTDACGNADLYCKFNHNVLGTNNSISTRFTFQDYNWHILIGWVIGIFIIPIAGFVFFMFQFVMKKHSGGSNKKCDGKSKECKILVGVGLGVAVGLSLIICIIIATQVCLSKMGTALGIGIGVSFGIMFISVVIIAIIFFTCMKEKPDGDVIKPTTDKSEEMNKPNKKAETFNNAKPIMQDKPKNKALDEVPKGRQLPSPRKDDEENKIRMPRSLPPLMHEENSTSSPKKKKKKRKSKENENEDKSE